MFGNFKGGKYVTVYCRELQFTRLNGIVFFTDIIRHKMCRILIFGQTVYVIKHISYKKFYISKALHYLINIVQQIRTTQYQKPHYCS